jgi:hypothetical protein
VVVEGDEGMKKCRKEWRKTINRACKVRKVWWWWWGGNMVSKMREWREEGIE